MRLSRLSIHATTTECSKLPPQKWPRRLNDAGWRCFAKSNVCLQCNPVSLAMECHTRARIANSQPCSPADVAIELR
jgi:hypothetical protein